MRDKLVAGLSRFGLILSERALDNELRYLEELLRWNNRVNLTSIRDPEVALEKHLLDSLVLLNYLDRTARLLDMGSGGGLPGIPLAIADQRLQVTSVDSVGKKVNFQKHVKRMLQITNFTPQQKRLEVLDSEEAFDFITARALSDLTTLSKFAGPVLKPGGRLLVMKGPEGEQELSAYLDRAEQNSFVLGGLYQYSLPESGDKRQLIILIKR